MGSNAPRMLGTTLLALTLAANTAAAATTRRVPEDYSTIQAALTAAMPGDRVVVGPGVWTENLDFQGKDVTLESAAGPATTIVQVPGGTGVRIGPHGALAGFTISGATASFGAAVEVPGSNTRIAGNIVQNNVQVSTSTAAWPRQGRSTATTSWSTTRSGSKSCSAPRPRTRYGRTTSSSATAPTTRASSARWERAEPQCQPVVPRCRDRRLQA